MGRWGGVCTLAVLVVALLPWSVGPAAGGATLVERPGDIRARNLAALTADLRSMPNLSEAAPATQMRHALVIGIDNYDELTDLHRAVSDSQRIATTMTDLGFRVTRLENLEIDAFDEALDQFYERLSAGDIAFVFFAGHGVALDGVNYLLPADMPALPSVKASRLDRYAVDAGHVLEEIERRDVELTFVVLDACRNNPFPAENQRGGVAIGGLMEMAPREGAFVIYSAGLGQTALDRLGADDPEPNSVFTRKFWQILRTPGLPVVEIAKRTQIEVSALAATVHHEQAPAYYDQIIGQFYFQPPRPRLYGLAIGIDDYGDRRVNLKGAVNDANLVAAALEAVGAERVERLLNDDARLRFIDYIWHDMLDEARPGDTIALTFSGNSTQEPDPADDREQDGKMELLLLSSREPLSNFFASGEGDPSRKITDKQLTQWMAEAADKNVNVLLLIDGCHGGGMLNREFANVSFIGAALENEVATEKNLGGARHGVASFAFANGLSGAADLNADGFVTQRELFVYVDENIYRINSRGNGPQLLPPITESGSGLALVHVVDAATRRAVDLSSYWAR